MMLELVFGSGGRKKAAYSSSACLGFSNAPMVGESASGRYSPQFWRKVEFVCGDEGWQSVESE
jgi:hypothetical protein